MSLRRSLSGIALGLGSLYGCSVAVWAQPVPAPEIRLPPEPAPGPQLLPQSDPAVAPPGAGAGAGAEIAPPALVAPPDRDRPDMAGAAPTSPASAGTLLPFLPAGALPEEVRMGPSLPEPGILRLTGEVGSVDLGLELPLTGAMPSELVLVQRSAINVLPDTAQLQLRVNGAEPVDLPLENLGEFGVLRVPAADLVPGANRLAMTIRQPHRVFCGPEASFGVWTEFDLGQSGALLPSGTLSADAAGFALAVRNQIGSGRPLRIVADDSSAPELLVAVAAALGRATEGRAQLEISSFYALGPRPAASIALIASDQSRISFRQGAGGGLVMQIEYRDGILPDIDAALPPFSLPGSGRVAQIQTGMPQLLASMGQDDIIGNTHYFRKDVPFALPANWLLLANQKARLILNYGFADDLPTGAILLVKVNDQTVHLLPLDRGGGRMQDPLTISFGARLLHAGVNALSFEMMVPGDPPDAACAYRSTDMLVISAETSLEVPGSPAMELAGLAAPLSGLTAEGIVLPPAAGEAAALRRFSTRLVAGLTPPDSPDPEARLTLVDFEHLALVPFDRKLLPLSVLQRALTPPRRDAGETVATGLALPRVRLSEGQPP